MSVTRFYQRPAFLYSIAIISSILLSCWIDARETVINPDAICYLYSAEAVGQLGWRSAMHLCPQAIWPFYSILIFAFGQFSHLSYGVAAFVLDGFFSLLTVIAFIALVKELGGTRRVLWLAAMAILFSHDFNVLRQDIIRDHGFWAFYLTSVFFLLRYFHQRHAVSALLWSTCLLIATSFRIEGAIFLLVLPLFSWFYTSESWGQRTRFFLTLNMPLFVLVAMIMGWSVWHSQLSVGELGRVAEVGNQLQHGFAIVAGKYQATKVAVSQSVLTHVSLRDASIVVFLLLISWYVVNVITNVSWIYAVLIGYAWIMKAAPFSRSAALVVWSYVVVNIGVTFVFFAENHFLAKRYLIAFSLILMLWVPFALNKLFQSSLSKQRLLGALAMIFVLISAVGGIFHFGHSKTNIRQAGDWLAENVPEKANLYANDYQLLYYSQHFGNTIFKKFEEYKDVNMIAHGHWHQYDYLALLVSKHKEDKAAHIMQEIHLTPLQVFVSNDGDHVYIYKVKVAKREKKS
jgi:hypothetical protein